MISLAGMPPVGLVQFSGKKAVKPVVEKAGNAHASQYSPIFPRVGEQPKVVALNHDRLGWVHPLLGNLIREQGLPPIDYSKQVLVVVLMPQSTAGSPVPQLKNMSYDAKRDELTLSFNKPDASGFATCVMGNPWYMAVINQDQLGKKQTVKLV